MTVDDDLHALQRRAYGADADIQDDPAAIARLRDLEAARRGTENRPPVADLPPSETDPGPGIRTPSASLGDAVSSDAEPSRRRWTRTVLACAATAVVTALVTVPVTRWLTAPETPQPYAVLRPYSDTEPLRYFDGPRAEDTLRYPDFYGIGLAVGGVSDDTGTCISVTVTPDMQSESCAPTGLNPQYDLAITRAPSASQVAFGTDAVLRFVFVGGDLQVFVLRAGGGTTPSELPPPSDAPVDSAP